MKNMGCGESQAAPTQDAALDIMRGMSKKVNTLGMEKGGM